MEMPPTSVPEVETLGEPPGLLGRTSGLLGGSLGLLRALLWTLEARVIFVRTRCEQRETSMALMLTSA
jgi:hypothetical protein